MSNEAIGYLGMLSLTLLILLRVPVAVSLGLVGFFGYSALEGWSKAGLALGGVPMELASAYGLSVVPLFMLMGALATTAGLSRDLFYGANVLFRRTRGALAMAAIAASAAFGAVCGSSVATAATLGRVSIPEMLKAKYSHQLAAGAVAVLSGWLLSGFWVVAGCLAGWMVLAFAAWKFSNSGSGARL